MNSLMHESSLEVGENIDKRLPPKQTDRFVRRLNKYRIHQSDCQIKSDLSFRELCEQESQHIRKLQEQKPLAGRQKRVNKRQSKKEVKVCA